jgi:hypothetical protein
MANNYNMIYIRNFSFTLFFVFLFTSLDAQEQFFSDNEKEIALLFDSLKIASEDKEKENINEKIIRLLSAELKENPGSFDYPYTLLKYVGQIYSNDKKVKIYTWSFHFSDMTYGYGGFIQHKPDNKNIYTIPLTIKKEAYIPPNNKRIFPTDWYGALYYQVISVKYKKEHYYALLGWSGYNAASDIKLIDFLSFENENKAYLGRPVLKQNSKTLQRFILEYDTAGQVVLTYDENLKKIIFDHLVPPEPVYTGIYSFYGPDFTYDAFSFNKGLWHFEENIDIKNKE